MTFESNLPFCALGFSLGNNMIKKRGNNEGRRDREIKCRKSSKNFEKEPKIAKKEKGKESKGGRE